MSSTEPFWQSFTDTPEISGPPFTDRFAVRMPDGRYLSLPLRVLPGDGDRAVASLLVNHASFAVADALAEAMTALTGPLRPEVIVGLPTLGLAVAPGVARHLGFSNYVPLGTSRKFWYRDELSVEVSSITSPGAGKRLYLDPNLGPRLAGRRVILVDDVVSRGTSLAAARRLMSLAVVNVVGAVVAMAQTDAWREPLAGLDLRAVFATPGFARRADGWWPLPGA
jgi:adenine/guanine phosphoribosyltransferase-like PRPP-binding protein